MEGGVLLLGVVGVAALDFEDEGEAGAEADEEVGAVLADDAAVHIEDFEAEVVVLDPRLDCGVGVEVRNGPAFPVAVADGDGYRALLRGLGVAGGVPDGHFRGAADGVFGVEEGDEDGVGGDLDGLLQVEDDAVHLEVDGDAAPGAFVRLRGRRRDDQEVGGDELVHDGGELGEEGRFRAAPAFGEEVVEVLGGLEDLGLEAVFAFPLQEVGVSDLRRGGFAVHDGGEVGFDHGAFAVEFERGHLGPVHDQFALHPVFDGEDVRPGDAVAGTRPLLDGDPGFRGRGVGFLLVGEEGEGDAEDIHIFRGEAAGLRVEVVGGAAEAPADDLFAEQLRSEGAETHDVGDGLRVPALGEHPDRDHIADAFAGLSALADGVHLLAESAGPLLRGRSVAPFRRGGFAVAAGGVGFALGFPQDGRIQVEQALRVAEFLDLDLLLLEGAVDAGRRFRAVRDGDHHRDAVAAPPFVRGLAPVVAEEGVGVSHQVGERRFRLRLLVQVVLDFRVVVEAVEARAERLLVFGFGGLRGGGVFADHDARGLDEAGLDGVVEAEVAHDPLEERLAGLRAGAGDEGRRGEVVADEDFPDAVEAVERFDPLRGPVPVVPGQLRRTEAGRDAPGVVALVVDHQQVAAGLREVGAENSAQPGAVALRAAAVHAALLQEFARVFPAERLPVADDDAGFAEFRHQAAGGDVEPGVVVVRGRRLQDGEAFADGAAGGHEEDIPGEAGVLRAGGAVQDLPGDQHRHHDGLSGAGGHLGADAGERAAVRGNADADAAGRRRFREPDQGFDRFELAEEEAVVFAVGFPPVAEEAQRGSGNAGIPGFAPLADERADAVDQSDLGEDSGVVRVGGARGGEPVTGGAAAGPAVESRGVVVVVPVLAGFRVGRVQDQRADLAARRRAAAHPAGSSFGRSRTRRLSRPRSSTILTAIRRCSPAAKGSDSVPR